MIQSSEQFLSTLNQMRKDLEEDPEDEEWVVLHHCFCFVSYKMNEFKEYWDEIANQKQEPNSSKS